MATAENFAGIDFDEIKEATALEVDEIKVMQMQILRVKIRLFKRNYFSSTFCRF